jgi:hypothetical protein
MARFSERKPNPTLSTLIGHCIFLVPLIVVFVLQGIASIQFDIDVTGYLKRAADANTIHIAEGELDKALASIEKRGLKDGRTGVLWQSPNTDVGFWYNNLVTARSELGNLSPDATSMEKSNMLIKLRETLIDHGKDGDKVTLPYSICLHPANGLYFMGFLAGILIAGCAVLSLMFNYSWD